MRVGNAKKDDSAKGGVGKRVRSSSSEVSFLYFMDMGFIDEWRMGIVRIKIEENRGEREKGRGRMGLCEIMSFFLSSFFSFFLCCLSLVLYFGNNFPLYINTKKQTNKPTDEIEARMQELPFLGQNSCLYRTNSVFPILPRPIRLYFLISISISSAPSRKNQPS